MSFTASGTLTSLGGTSKTVFLATEEYKISFQATASVALSSGQPVKLTTNGQLAVWTSADGRSACIGVVYGDHASGELATVLSRGCMIIYGIAAAIQNAGLVTVSAYDSTTLVGGAKGYNVFAITVTDTQIIGWALDAAAAANALIRVLIMG